MRILFLNFKITDFLSDRPVNTGGACSLQYNLGKGLQEIGYEVAFLVYRGAKENIVNSQGFDLIETYDKNAYRNRFDWLLRVAPGVLKGIRKYRPDVVVQSGAGTITGVISLLARIVRKPFIFMAVSDWEADGAFLSEAPFFEKTSFHYGLKYAQHIIAQNEYQKEHFKKKEGKDSTIIRTAYNMSYPDFRPSDRVTNPYVLWSGNFRPAKGIDRLFRIAKSAPDILFKITGKQIYQDPAFDSLLEELFSLPNVEMMGYLFFADLCEVFHGASIFLNTSEREGFPTTFIDAWYYGLSVVTVKYDPDHLISDNNLGYVCKAEGDVPVVIRQLIAHNGDADRARISRYARLHHSPVSIAKRFAATLTRVVS